MTGPSQQIENPRNIFIGLVEISYLKIKRYLPILEFGKCNIGSSNLRDHIALQKY